MKADTLFLNGNFFISSTFQKPIHWLAVKDGRVAAMGPGKPDRHVLYQRKVDVNGKHVFPGWIDSHAHLFNLGLRSFELDVSLCRSNSELIQRLRQYAGKQSWIEAYGLDIEKWRGPKLTFRELDRVSLTAPIVIRRVDEHAVFINTPLMKLAGKYQQGDGNHSGGLFQDGALDGIFRFKPSPPSETIRKALIRAGQSFVRYGITSVHDLSMRHAPLAVLMELMRCKAFPLRVNCALYGEDTFENYSRPEMFLFDYHLSIRAKKIFIDGALGSRGAWLLAPYADQPEWEGLCLYDAEGLFNAVRQAIQKRFQLVFHVMGDRASRWVLETLASRYYPKDLRHQRVRFEHVEILDPNLFSMMKRFGIISSVQPGHVVSDRPWLQRRLGRHRLKYILPLRGLLKYGIPVCGGSDSPIEHHDPLQGIYAAVTREREHRIQIGEALKIYTEGGAYAEFAEGIKGNLEIGKLADFCVLSDTVLGGHPGRLLSIKNLMTVVGGRIVYEGSV